MEDEIKEWHQQRVCFENYGGNLWDPHTMNLGRTSVIGLGGRGTLSQDSLYQTAEGQVMRIGLPHVKAHAVLALSLPSTLCKHQQNFGRWCPTLGREPKRESGVTSDDSCLLDTSAADSSSQRGEWRGLEMRGKKGKSERTGAVSCERTNVMHLVMVPR